LTQKDRKRAACYCRVSTDDQVGRGLSLPAQERVVRELAARDGYIIAEEHVFVDPGISGSRSDRPAYQTLLAAAKAGAFSVLYVWKIDRFGRDAEEMLRARRLLGEAGVRIVSATEGEDDGTLIFGVRALVSQDLLEKISVDTRRGLRETALAGIQPCGEPPLGYRAVGEKTRTDDTRQWIIDEAEAMLVHRIDSLYIGGKGASGIARIFNGEGIRTRRGAEFSTRVILDILQNKHYLGLVVLKGEEFPGKHEAIRSLETHLAIQAEHARRSEGENKGRGRPPKGLHLITNLTGRCACGRAMALRTHKRSQYYICNRENAALGSCPAQQPGMSPRWNRRETDEAFLTHIETLHLDRDATVALLEEHLQRRSNEAAGLAELADREVARTAEGLRRADRAFMSGKLSPENYERLTAEAQGEMEAAEAEAARLRARAKEIADEGGVIDARQAAIERIYALRALVAGRSSGGVEDLGSVRAMVRELFAEVVFEITPDGERQLIPRLRNETYRFTDVPRGGVSITEAQVRDGKVLKKVRRRVQVEPVDPKVALRLGEQMKPKDASPPGRRGRRGRST
jgi:DNA invertase Pin-like site-specific DNA recombinase